MKPLYWLVSAALMVACSLLTFAAPPPPTQASPAQPTPTLATVPTAEPGITPTLEPVALAGPPMEVGSMWPYVGGSLLVAVPGGPFTMGHGGSDNPEHTVTLSDFWIYQAKVTNQQYALCVKAGKCKAPDPVDDFTFKDLTHANDPVVGVNWQQASDYCGFVHGRLPTEAEWEKAARGPDGNIYPWGSNAPVCDFLNFNNCVGKITDVTTYQKGQSFYHALDMEGNVFEWVADWYDALYYRSSAGQDPQGPDAGQVRSVRSSSYKSKADQIAASTRFSDGPKDHRRDLGFRCVVEDPAYFAPMCQTLNLLGGSVTPTCPDVNIGLTKVCQQGKITVVILDSVSPDPAATVTGVGACTPISVTPGAFPQIYDCTSDTTVNITTFCSYASSSPATCADHYKLDTRSGMCIWDGTLTPGNACLPGLTYDAVNQCCSADPASGSQYPVCPLGTTLGSVKGIPVCVPAGSSVDTKSQTEYLHIQDPKTCTGGSSTTKGACPAGTVQYCVATGIANVCTCIKPAP